MAPQMLVTEPLEPPMMSSYSIDSFPVLDKMPTHSPTEVEMSRAQSEAFKLRKTRSLKGLPAHLLSLGPYRIHHNTEQKPKPMKIYEDHEDRTLIRT